MCDSVRLGIGYAKKFYEHLATTALLATRGNRRIASLNCRMCHWRLCAPWMMKLRVWSVKITLILRRSHTGTVWFYTSTRNKRAARPKLYTKSLTRDLKRMYSRFTLVRISINL